LRSASDRIQTCILQPNPFGRELESLVRGESLDGRPLSIKELNAADGIAGCHVVFVSTGAVGRASVDAHLTKPADPRLLEKLLLEVPRVST
jgi:hypothetical protein